MKRMLNIGILLLAVLGGLFFSYPRPNQSFLFSVLPELANKTKGLIGSSAVLFLDPSLYYRFDMSEADFMQLMKELALEPVSPDNYTYYRDYVFTPHQPPLVHRWWW